MKIPYEGMGLLGEETSAKSLPRGILRTNFRAEMLSR
jgi:hypothetical protein